MSQSKQWKTGSLETSFVFIFRIQWIRFWISASEWESNSDKHNMIIQRQVESNYLHT